MMGRVLKKKNGTITSLRFHRRVFSRAGGEKANKPIKSGLSRKHVIETYDEGIETPAG